MALIYQLPTPIPGTQGTLPEMKFMVVGDDLATLTAANYLNQITLESFIVAPTDIIQVLYNFNKQTQVGTYLACKVSISNLGIITLLPTGPVSSGRTAIYAGGSNLVDFTVAGITAATNVAVSLMTSTNGVDIRSVNTGTNTITIGFSADPGANTQLSYIAYN